MRPALLHSYLLWRSALSPSMEQLAHFRFTASMALLPAVMVGLFVYGWYAGLVVLAALLGAWVTDLVGHRFSGGWIFQNPQGTRDGTWLLSGLLVGLLMPPAVPLWVPILGGVLAVAVGKHWMSVDGMPFLQPAAVAILALHILMAPFGHMHPSSVVSREVVGFHAADGALAPGPMVGSFKEGNQAEARVERIEAPGSGTWLVKGVIRNGRPNDLSALKVEIRFQSKGGEKVQTGTWTSPDPIPNGAKQSFSIELPEPAETVSYELALSYEEEVPKWPFLIWASSPTQQDEKKGIVAHLLKNYLKGDIRRSMDRQAYLDQLFSGRQPMFDDKRHAEAVFGPRPIDLIKQYPGKSVADLGGANRYDGWHVFMGGTSGPIGGGSGLALIFGILLLLFARVISWVLPLAAVGTLLAGMYVAREQNIGVQMLSGYTLVGIFFLAANPVTAPRSKRGKFLAGLMFGVLELFFRKAMPFSEGTFLTVPIVQGMSMVIDQFLAPPKEEPGLDTGPALGALERL